MFNLRKWYFDLVTEDGTAFVGYSARLRWGLLRARYRATLLHRDGLPTEETSTIRRSPDPKLLPDGSVSWTCKPLGVSGHWIPRAPPIRKRLFESPAGVADWDCFVPVANVVLQLGDETLKGLGYAEQLVLTAPPWKLGTGDLFWGRFLEPATSVVWVHWTGTDAPPLLMVNGIDQPGATVGLDGVGLPGTEAALELGAPTVLREGPILEVLAAVPRLARRLPGGLDRVMERKWLSPGRWVGDGADPVSGWAIHEVVEWHSPEAG